MKIVLFGNCQSTGVAHFIRKVRPELDVRVYLNYRLILGEENPDDLMRDAADCDAFVYQPTDALKHGMLSSAEMIQKAVPAAAIKVSFPYCFNTGFFPIVKYGQWWTSHSVLGIARLQPHLLEARYGLDDLHYDCARRFAENLAEQSRREEACDLKFAPYILQNFQTKHLFLVCNHPTSEFFVHMANEVLRAIGKPYNGPIPFTHPNEVGLPGYHALHPAVIRELGLQYTTDPNDGADKDWYRKMFVELAEKRGAM